MKSSLQGAAYAAKETSHDAALTTKVKAAFALSKRIPSDKISVDSQGESVTLRGEVPSDQIRNLAESVAGDVPGVEEVHNHIYALNRTQ
jgi:osmotically-inducible protein OsmY